MSPILLADRWTGKKGSLIHLVSAIQSGVYRQNRDELIWAGLLPPLLLAAWLAFDNVKAKEADILAGREALRRTEQRAVVLQLERLMEYPMVRSRVQSGQISLHGWHYVIEDGEVHVFDVQTGGFVPASQSDHSGTGPYQPYVEHDGQVLVDE